MSNEHGCVGVVRWVVLALSLGCTAPVADPPAASTPVGSIAPGAVVASATIGAAGGTLTSADGRVAVIIPAGALSADTMLSVAPITNNAHGGIGAAYRMTGAETFAQPVSLRFSYLDEELAGTTAQFLDVAWQTQDGFWQLADTATVDAAAKTVTATTTHFTDWSFVARFRLNPAVARLKINQARVFQLEHSYPIYGKRARPADDAPLLGFGWLPVSPGYGSRVASGWSVDGIAGGNSTVGTIYADVERGGYAAPEKKPRPDTVTVSVKVTNPLDASDHGEIEAQVTIADDELPQTYSGTLTHHYKVGGPSTPYLPLEYRVESQVTFTRSSSSAASYQLTAGSATLLSGSTDLDSACHCTAQSASGTVNADASMTITATADSLSSFSWGASFTVPIGCTGSTDFYCTNPQPQIIGPAWSLGTMDPSCTGMVQNAFTNPRQISGSWSITCPGSQGGIVTETTWALQGSD